MSSLFAGATNTDISSSNINSVGHDQYINTAGRDQYNIFANRTPEDNDILGTLNPAKGGGFYVPPCMEGTRRDILQQISLWIGDLDAPNILWLSGGPGAGKSAIASTLVQQLREEGRLGSSFFFNRHDAGLNDPAVLWRSVAHGLARFDSKFARSLIAVLKEGRVDPERPEIHLHFKLMIEEPLTMNSDHFSQNRFPIIVIDALDECRSDGATAAQHRILFDTLARWSQFPKTFKLIVTGREGCIPNLFRGVCKQIVLFTGDLATVQSGNDIRHFFEDRFSRITGLLPSKWPGKTAIDRLTVHAAGLFIWAETVMKFMEQGLPEEQLRLVFEGNFGGSDDTANLYQQLLEILFKDSEGRTLDVLNAVLATIVLSKVPLYPCDLHYFVLEPESHISWILRKLSSVISTGLDGRLRISHLSFAEFLCERRRHPNHFFIDRSKASERLTLSCFRIMEDGLMFNICGLESSHVRNDDVENLAAQIEKCIPTHLSYSCRFWARHLRDVTIVSDHPVRTSQFGNPVLTVWVKLRTKTGLMRLTRICVTSRFLASPPPTCISFLSASTGAAC